MKYLKLFENFNNLESVIYDEISKLDRKYLDESWDREVGLYKKYGTGRALAGVESMFLNIEPEDVNKSGITLDTFLKEFSDTLVSNSKLNTDNTITLYRALSLENEEELKKPFGIYWSYSKGCANVYNDVGYGKTITEKDKTYILSGDFKINQINWKHTVDLFFISGFGECEITIKEGEHPIKWDLKLK
jgi:hypothetical protein